MSPAFVQPLNRIAIRPRVRQQSFAAVFAALLTGLLTSGCATLEGKVTASTVADTSYFADQTISMLSSAQLQMEKDRSIYTREFWDDNDPDEQRFIELERMVLGIFRDVIAYSLELVRIAESRTSEAKQIEMYADWFGPWDNLALERVRMDKEKYDNVIAAIREAKDLRKAFQAAQPFLNAANFTMNELLDEMVSVANVVARKADARIDAEFAEVIRYQEALGEEKYAVLSALRDVYRVNRGDKGAYETLKKNPAFRRKDILPARSPNDQQLRVIADHLVERLEGLHLVGTQIEPEWTIYRETHRELDQMHADLESDVNTVRVLMLVWVHAHYQMASGRKEAAEWFDITDIGKDVGTAAVKMLF